MTVEATPSSCTISLVVILSFFEIIQYNSDINKGCTLKFYEYTHTNPTPMSIFID